MVARAAGQDVEQADGDVEGVVVAVEAVLVEDVAGHLARERGADLGHLGLDQGVAGLPHQGLAAEPGDLVEEGLAGLDVGDDRGARVARQHVGGQDLQDLVAEDDPALAVDHADPVAVAVEADAELVAAVGHLADQVDQVVRLGRVGVVVGEAAVDLGEQALVAAGQAGGEGRHGRAGRSRCRRPRRRESGAGAVIVRRARRST